MSLKGSGGTLRLKDFDRFGGHSPGSKTWASGPYFVVFGPRRLVPSPFIGECFQFGKGL